MWKVSSWQYLIEHRGDEPHLSFTWEERWVKREFRFEKISRYLQMPLGLIFCTQWIQLCVVLVVIMLQKYPNTFQRHHKSFIYSLKQLNTSFWQLSNTWRHKQKFLSAQNSLPALATPVCASMKAELFQHASSQGSTRCQQILPGTQWRISYLYW